MDIDVTRLAIEIKVEGEEQARKAIDEIKAKGAAASKTPVRLNVDATSVQEAIGLLEKMKTEGIKGATIRVRTSGTNEAIAANKQINEAIKTIGETGNKVNVVLARQGREFESHKSTVEYLNDRLLRTARIIASIAVAYYSLRTAIDIMKSALNVVDEYHVTTIGIAATMTDMAKDQSNAYGNFIQNLSYARDTYEKLEMAAAKYFATGQELIQGWNILAQNRIVLQGEEIEYLGIIVDKVKLLTVGQTSSVQIAQELRAALTGQARATDQLARLVKDRLGGAWHEVFDEIRRTGSLEPLARMLPGMEVARPFVEDTLLAQISTTSTYMRQAIRTGMIDPYQETVNWIKEINKYIRENREYIGSQLKGAWDGVRNVLYVIKELLITIKDLVKDPVMAAIIGAGVGLAVRGIPGAIAGGATAGGIAAGGLGYPGWPIAGAVAGGIAGARFGPQGAGIGMGIGGGIGLLAQLQLERATAKKVEEEYLRRLSESGTASFKEYLEAMKTGSRSWWELLNEWTEIKERTWKEAEEAIEALQKGLQVPTGLPPTQQEPWVRQWKEEAVAALTSANSLIATMGQELGKSTENHFGRIVSHMFKLNDSIEKSITKMREFGETQKMSIAFERQLYELRDKIIKEGIEKSNREFYQFYLDTIVGGTIGGEAKKIEFKYEELRRKFTPSKEGGFLGGIMSGLLEGGSALEKTLVSVGDKGVESATRFGNSWKFQIEELTDRLDELLKLFDRFGNKGKSSPYSNIPIPPSGAYATDYGGYYKIFENFMGGLEYRRQMEGKYPQFPLQIDTRPLSQQIADAVEEAANKYPRIGADFIRIMIAAESGGRVGAVSPKGAKGLMQLMPGTALDMEVTDIFDPRQNIMGGAKYFDLMLDKFKDRWLALMAYNWGPANVDKWIEAGAPRTGIRKETYDYVNKIFSKYTGLESTKAWQQVADKALAAKMGGYDKEGIQELGKAIELYRTELNDTIKINEMVKNTADILAGMNLTYQEQNEWRTYALGFEKEILRSKTEQLILDAGLEAYDQIHGTHIVEYLRKNTENIIKEKEKDDLLKSQLNKLEAQKSILGQYEKYLSGLSSNMPLVTDQLKYQEASLHIQQAVAKIDLAEYLEKNQNLSSVQKEELATLLLLEQAAQRYQLTVKKWETQDILGGINIWALERIKKSLTEISGIVKSVLEDVEQQVSKGIGEQLINYFSGKGFDLKAIARTIVSSLLQKGLDLGVGQVFTGVAKLWQWITGTEVGTQQTQAELSAMTIEQGGIAAGLAILEYCYEAAEVLGNAVPSVGGGVPGGLGGAEIPDGEGFFGREQSQIQSFGSTALGVIDNIENRWISSQQNMTAASGAGNIARMSSLLGAGSQIIGIISKIAQAAVIKDAGMAAAAGFRSVMQSVPFPLNIALAPIIAAVAFAGTLAAGLMGGGGYQGTGPGNNMSEFPSPYHSGGIVRLVRAHQGMHLAHDEVPLIGQVGEYMVSRRGVDAVGVPFLNAVNAGYVPQSGSSINFTYAPQVNAIDAKGVDKVLEKHGKQMLKNLKQSHRDYSYGRMITK